MTVPVLVVPFLNRPDLLDKMIASVDDDIGKLIVIDNSKEGLAGKANLPAHVRVVTLGHNLGVSASWNLGIKITPLASWWCFANADLILAPGDLVHLADAVDEYRGLIKAPDMAFFAITPEVIQQVGWFDENYVPAYCEDDDYVYRCQLMGVKITNIPSGYEHYGSAVIRSDDRYFAENSRTYPQNVAYHEEKWGGKMHEERFQTPFNNGHSPTEWHLNHRRLADLTWR